MQLTQNPKKQGILATLLTVTTLATLSSVQSKFLFERLSLHGHKAAKNPVLVSDSNPLALMDTHMLQQSVAAAANISIVNYNLTWLNTQSYNATDDIINNTNPRLQTSIRLDKDVYAPKDVVFAEVLLLNALNKTPVALSTTDRTYQQYYNLTLEILDTGNNVLYNSTTVAGNSSSGFAYKLGDSLPAGVYTVRAYNQFVPVITTSFNVQPQLKDPAIVNIQLPQSVYNLGDTVRGIVQILTSNGAQLPSTAVVSFNVSFGNSTVANTTVTLSSRGDAVISFAIPRYAASQAPIITFTVRTANWTHVYAQSFSLVNPDQLVIDFFSGSGYLTNNILNTIYFQVWANSNKDTPLDITNGTLKQQLTAAKVETVLLPGTINTVAKGKGSFQWTPIATTGSVAPVFEVVVNGITIRRTVSFVASAFQPTQTSEVQVSINNANRYLGNNDDLSLTLSTNGTVNSTEIYVIQIKNADVVLFQDQLTLTANSTKVLNISAKNFSLINGGVLSASLYKTTRVLENFYKSRNGTNATVVSAYTPPVTVTVNYTVSVKNTTTNITTNVTRQNTTIVSYASTKNVTSYVPPDFANTTIAAQFLEAKAEVLFFKKPSDTLKVAVTLDKAVPYLPGDAVAYTVTINNATTGRPVTVDSYITLSVTDINGLVNPQGAQLPARSFLGAQIKNFNNEAIYSQVLINNILSGATNDTKYIDVLLGVQGWRVGAFDVRSIVLAPTLLRTAAPADIAAINALYGVVVGNQTATKPVASVVRPSIIRSGRQANDSASVDFMMNLTSSAKGYSHAKRAGWTAAQKIDLTQTVAWQSTVPVKAGSFKGTLVLNDLTTSYLLQADAFNAAGNLGSGVATIATRDVLAISYTLPKFLVNGDSLKIPITIANQGSVALQIRLAELANDSALKVVVPTAAINLAANSAISSFVTITGVSEKTIAQVTILANATASGVTYTTSQDGSFSVVPVNFVYLQQSRGGLIGSTTKVPGNANTAVLNVAVPPESNSTAQAFSMTVYPTFLSLLEAARQTLVAGPQGNFEQVTATIYPLIHRFNALKAAVQTSDVQVQTVQLQAQIAQQYQQLLTHAIPDGANFKFAGEDLSPEAMTAYALIFFTDLATNNTIVDNTLLNGLYNYLLAKKNNRGGFIQTLDGLSVGLPQITHDAWIVYALTYYNAAVNVTLEINSLRSAADNQISSGRVDSHLVALLANSLYKLRRTADAQIYADALVKVQNPDGSLAIQNPVATSFNGATGQHLCFQATALTVFVWNNNVARYTSSITNATNYLYSNIQQGVIGDSSSTTLALKAIQTHFAQFQTINGNGTFTVSINDQLVSVVPFTPSTTDAINIDLSSYTNNKNNSRYVAPGQSLIIQLSVVNVTQDRTVTKDFRAIYAFNHKYLLNSTYVPPPPVNVTPEFNITLTVGRNAIGLDANNGKAYNYTVSFKNIMIPGTPASGPVNLVIGAPSCLALDETYANFLINTGVIAGYEVVDNGLTVLLLKSMAPGEIKSLNVQYKQSYAGTCVVRDNLVYQTNGDFQLGAKAKTA